MSDTPQERRITTIFDRQHRDLTLRVGKVYRVEPLNKQKLKHRGRTCTLLGFVPRSELDPKSELVGDVVFSDTKRRGRVDLGDLIET